MDDVIWAFVDESGDTNLDTQREGISRYFIVCAIIIRSSELASARAALENVRAKHFQTGEMKSQKLRSDQKRWREVVDDLVPIPFRFYGLVVDKENLNRASGYQWKKTFYKNLCGRVYSKLMRAYPSLHIRADQHGTESFQSSFVRYVEQHHRPTLFEKASFDLVDSKNDVIVQLADLMSGLCARIYEPRRTMAVSIELLKSISSKLLLLDEWPPRFRVTTGRTELSDGKDDRIASLSLREAEKYVADQ
jgi:hypothetical protein